MIFKLFGVMNRLKLTALIILCGLAGTLKGQAINPANHDCSYRSVPGVVFWSGQRQITIRDFAAYCAPVFWFSPDEPTMKDLEGKEIRVPETIPFEEVPDSPVVYYQYNRIVNRADNDGPGFIPDSTDYNNSLIDLNNIVAVNLKFIAYFSFEEGLGGHAHDVEPAEFRIIVVNTGELKENRPEQDCGEDHYVIGIEKVTAEAHGLDWFFNISETDPDSRFPMHLLVEEGKHGLCTDKNSDGYYTPGYDVSRHVNDAWGVRDIIRGGALFTGSYQAWMAKVRRPEHRVFPPLPDDSPLIARMARTTDGEYARDNAVYELRAFPPSAKAIDDYLLRHKMAEKEQVDWPTQTEISTLGEFEDLLGEGRFLKSFAISFRADGDLGLSFVFPFFIIKNLEDPVAGGFVTHRMYLKDKGLRDFGWLIHYTPSASRWIDNYLSVGAEWDQEPIRIGSDTTKTKTDFVLETGIKFRVNITKSPLKFLGWFTEYWGFRAGIKNKGFFDIDRLTYVLEFGAGVW